MARTLTQVQATLTKLYATYDTLADRYAASYDEGGRAMVHLKMQDVRGEIEQLEQLEQQLGAETDSPAPGVAYVKFEDPS